jgi:hypothetical protein
LDALRQWFMRQIFVEYCTVFARMRRHAQYVSDSSVVVSDTCAVHAWFVSDFYSQHPKKLVNFSTHKHAQTQSVRDLWVIRAWSAVWLALTYAILFKHFPTGYGFSPDSVSTTDKSTVTWHRIVEAMKFAYAKRSSLGDPDKESQSFKDNIDSVRVFCIVLPPCSLIV